MGERMGEADARRIRVLVVDNNELTFLAINKLLSGGSQGREFEIHMALSYSDALGELMNGLIDVCLLDAHLDQRTGQDLLRAIDALDLHIPIIMLVDDLQSEADASYLEAGAVDCLDKERLTLPAITRAVRYGMERKRVELELIRTRRELSQQNLALSASIRRLEDAHLANQRLLGRLKSIQTTKLDPLQTLIDDARDASDDEIVDLYPHLVHALQDFAASYRPLLDEQAAYEDIHSKRVLLAESDRKMQIIARMALRGSGVAIDIAKTEEEGKALLARNHYDIIFVDRPLLSLAAIAHAYDEAAKIVFLTTERPSEYVDVLHDHPFMMNIVARPENNRNMALRNIMVTVSKLATGDYFGLEKYLGWGVDVHEHVIDSSLGRRRLVDAMEEDFRAIGIRPSFIRSAVLIAEELLMNAIYDAPVDAGGTPIYNHLPRTQDIELPAPEQGRFRYACDGTFLAISAEDPFGALKQQTILRYLHSCYEGLAGSLQNGKGGAGQGLFQIIESSTILAINVEAGLRTEVIAIVAVDPELRAKGRDKAGSLHFFCS
jgi:CheY-like chemotaxis protein